MFVACALNAYLLGWLIYEGESDESSRMWINFPEDGDLLVAPLVISEGQRCQ